MPIILHTPSNNSRAEVLVTGKFNFCHAGHIQLFEFASKYGKVTVGINGDEYMKTQYGDKTIPLLNRAYVIKSCRFVDEVVFFNEKNPSDLILKLRPKYFIRGPDYFNKILPEAEALQAVGAKLIIHNVDKIYNSSELTPQLEKQAFEALI